MTRVPSLVAPAVLLVLATGLACDKGKPEGTTPPADPGASNDAAAEPTGDAGDSSEPDTGAAAPTRAACDAKTSDAPVALFGEQVLIRPPVNVDLQEDNPTMAVAQVSGGFISACDAPVDRMNLMIFPNDKKKPLKDFTSEFVDVYLVKGGYTGGTSQGLKQQSDTDYRVKVDYPAADGQAASTLYIAVERRFNNVFAIVFQTPTDAYKVLEPTFEASASSLLVKPPS